MKLDIQYNKLGIEVDSLVAEQLNSQDLRKLENIRKISNLGAGMSTWLVHSTPSRNYILAIAVFDQTVQTFFDHPNLPNF